MSDAETIDEYNRQASDCVGTYELLRFEEVHAEILDLIPQKPGAVLDVGAGSGRDASWFARNDWEVLAVDPALKMLEQAKAIHTEAGLWCEKGIEPFF